ncbi:AAA family ATPase [Micromonospora nigra]|uniref:AAA family ATPase n=1 Tax=Micromonospora nigra TaxID=145857 RepID=UPI000B87447B|nr:AAA family ATPase [Micromonospora nigra]
MGKSKSRSPYRNLGARSRPRADEVQADLALAARRAEDGSELVNALTTEALTPAQRSSEEVLTTYDKLTLQIEEYRRCALAATAREEAARTREEAARAREEAARAREEAAEADRQRIRTDLNLAAQAQAEAEEIRGRLARAEARLDERDAQLRDREKAAEAGFVAEAERARAALDAELAELRRAASAEVAAERERWVTERTEALAEIEQTRRDRLADAERVHAELAQERQQLTTRAQQLDYDQGALRGQEIQLERRERDLEREVTARAAAEVTALDRDLQVLRIQYAAAEEAVADLHGRLAEREQVLLKIGSSDPAHVLDEMERLRAQNAELRDKLAARIGDEDLDRLRWLEQQNRELNTAREQLSYELQELRGAALADRINNLQVKQLADAERHFEVLTRGYEGRIAELRSAIDALYQDRPDPGTPLFPRCVAMDDDPALDEPGEVSGDLPDLAGFARSLQTTMFAEHDRAYRLNDICVLLGGLAMSRLHLLEGMSGIGKTSLPRALAGALGTDCAVIEVQAGWRDRTDLFGHHNTFERRFEETEFLQALYRAQTPRHRDRPFFIVLDEMNLSRPEQYFSVLLSKLENDDGVPIQLVTRGDGRAPRQLVGGTSIVLPPNVWFIGTANQDESTLEFADKTYNRAHLMELPAQRPRLDRRPVPALPPYGTDTLRRAFKQARRAHREDEKAVLAFVEYLTGDLQEHGRALLGPRVEKQLRAFTPVVVAARQGDPTGEQPEYGDADQDGRSLAADHFLAMKVLRTVRGRYDVTVTGLGKLREAIRTAWDLHKMAGEPVRCVRLLDDEVHRRES